jgi:hypothetical protein
VQLVVAVATSLNVVGAAAGRNVRIAAIYWFRASLIFGVRRDVR